MSNAALSKTEAQMCNGLSSNSSPTSCRADAPSCPNQGFSVIRHRSPGIMDCKNSSDVVVDIIGKICTARASLSTAEETMSSHRPELSQFSQLDNEIMSARHLIISKCNLISAILPCKLCDQDLYRSGHHLRELQVFRIFLS